MTGTDSKVELLGARSDADAYRIRDFLHRSGVPFEWRELATDEQARTRAQVDRLGDPRLPVCRFPDGSRLEHPTLRQVTEKLGWFNHPSREEYDVAIFGGGPAGLSAAVYAASEGLRTVLVERAALGGQASTSPRIENYLGFPEGVSGAELAERARTQAARFGAELVLLEEKVRGEFQPGRGICHLSDGTKLVAQASVCATGMRYRRLGLPDEERLFGAGVFYGGGASEAELCARAPVFTVGGGNSSGQAALHFARYAAAVTMVVRDRTLKTTMSRYLIDRIETDPRIAVRYETEVTALRGGRTLEEITLRNRRTGEQRTEATNWLFLCLGGEPNTGWADGSPIARDSAGYLLTGSDLLHDGARPAAWPLDRDPYHLETSVPGVFAAGDVRHGSVKRCAAAVGEGANAVTLVHRYLTGGI